jgi:2-polyprenyl-3-methyl-5-hydroxy-6-metoxy-1,4-benzoquinol methylase
MDTRSQEYREYLESKYLPGRRLYLDGWIYPRYLKEFVPGTIYDFGCGVGSFLGFCKRRGVSAVGIDSNPSMVEACLAHGLKAQVDDVVSPRTITVPISNVICDNVLEHLTEDRIELFFESMKSLIRREGVLLLVVPNRKGFSRDPTHVTFVERDLIERIARDHGLSLSLKFNFPLKNRFLGERFVFNMTIYRIVF